MEKILISGTQAAQMLGYGKNNKKFELNFVNEGKICPVLLPGKKRPLYFIGEIVQLAEVHKQKKINGCLIKEIADEIIGRFRTTELNNNK